MRRYIILLLLISGLVLISCDRRDTQAEYVPFGSFVISDNFDFRTTDQIDLNLQVRTGANQPVPGVIFSVYTDDPANGGDLIARGATNLNGEYNTTKSLARSYTHVWVSGNFETKRVPIVNDRVTLKYGGQQKMVSGKFELPSSKSYQYLPGMAYDANGLPSPMTSEIVTPGLISRINYLLPDGSSLPDRYPIFFTPGLRTVLKVDEHAEIFLTFVDEGAGYKNSVGFYVYPQGTVVNSLADIGPITLIFPNASKAGAGGSLNMNDTVYLGEVPGGMMIGWFIVADGFVSGSMVDSTKPHYYSDNILNPESNPLLRQHVIQAYDWETESIILAFEDLNRQGGADNDFNDLIFKVRATPFSALDITGLPPINPDDDSDGDGIPDEFDDYPSDPDAAFNNYTPSQYGWGTLAYEDLWPQLGDYDFNDLVIDYNINQVTNASNQVVRVENRFKLAANGARHKNGFGVQFPFSSANIQSFSTSHPGLVTHETDGPKAVFRLFDNAFYLIPEQPGNNFINTNPALPYFEPVEVTLNIVLNSPILISSFEFQAPFNPFSFATLERGKEVHLPGYPPTHLANMAYFNTMDDGSDPGAGRYYYSKQNLPYALHVPIKWNYPLEKNQVSRGYLKLKDWAQSNGVSFPNWYLPQPGYTDPTYIYYRP